MDVVATSYINESIRRNGIKSVQLSHDSLAKRGITPIFRTGIANYYDKETADQFVSQFVEEVKKPKYEINAREVISKAMGRKYKQDMTKYLDGAGIKDFDSHENGVGIHYFITQEQAAALVDYVKSTHKRRGQRQSKYRELDGLARLEAKIDKLLAIWESK